MLIFLRLYFNLKKIGFYNFLDRFFYLKNKYFEKKNFKRT